MVILTFFSTLLWKQKVGTFCKFLELKDKYDLCDIWKIKHPKTKTFTVREK